MACATRASLPGRLLSLTLRAYDGWPRNVCLPSTTYWRQCARILPSALAASRLHLALVPRYEVRQCMLATHFL